MLYYPGGGLGSAHPGLEDRTDGQNLGNLWKEGEQVWGQLKRETNDACYDRGLRKGFAEWILIANTILYEHNRRLLLVDRPCELRRYRVLINGLVSADYVVERAYNSTCVSDNYEATVPRSERLCFEVGS